MLFEALASGGGSDWYYTVLMQVTENANITLDDGDEEVTATGAGLNTIIGIPVHNPSSAYTVSVEMDGFTAPTQTVNTPATSGGISTELIFNFATINMTYDNEFRGQTATITDGTHTQTATLPAAPSNLFTVHVPYTGNWRISAEDSVDHQLFYTSPDPIPITSLTQTSNVNMFVIPNGETVLPVNDIETWLLCADIKNTGYTTLAEVLADEDVLFKVLTDDNANKYLKRSTDWINEGIIPEMIDATHPSGVVTCSSAYSGYSDYNAFNTSSNTGWVPAQNDAGWIQYQFDNPVKIGRVDIKGCGGSSSAVFQVKLFGSNDGFATPGDELGTINVTFGNTLNVEDIITNNTYAYYRVVHQSSSAYQGGDGLKIQFYPYSEGINDSELAMQIIGADDFASDILLSDATWREAICGSAYLDDVLNVEVPAMTANNAPEGLAFADSEYSADYAAWKAFNGSLGSSSKYWRGANGTAANAFIGYRFNKPIKIYDLKLGCYEDGTSVGVNTKAFKIQYSNDTTTGADGTWSDLDNFTNSNPTVQLQNFNLSTANIPEAYGWRIRILTQWGSGQPCGNVGALQFYGREAGGVQTLLKAAGISRPYTTIDELLADHVTLQKVISSHDAIDYLVETKAFIEEITSDATAMRYIGKRNYAANTLLADTNPGLVPVMTDATHPEGTVGTNTTTSSGPAWKAFNSGESYGWYTSTAPHMAVGDWVSYEFTNPTECVSAKALMKYEDRTNTVSGKIQAYDITLGDWKDISDIFTLTANSENTPSVISLNTEGVAYSKYRWICTTGAATSYWGGIKLQFYAKPANKPVWMEAIRDSEYFESVLNLTVPVLTGPNANATASTENTRLGAYAWNAFDGDPSDGGWLSADNTSNGWVQYKFPSAVKILCAKGFQRSQTPWSTYANYGYEVTIQGLKTDGGTPVDLKKVSTSVLAQCSTECKINIDIPDDYLAYRMYITRNSSGADYVVLAGLQFYGRRDVDETMIDVYSAANDSFYEKDSSGNIQIIDTTDSDGHAQVSRTDLPNGIHTLYSSVAKNPNDLTEDYFKTVKIDDSTIEICIMPDDVGYWWGYKGNIEHCETDNGWTPLASSYPFISVTWNTQNVTSYTNSAGFSWIGSKKAVKTKEANLIYKGVTYQENCCGELCLYASKALNGVKINETQLRDPQGQVSKVTCKQSTPIECYVTAGSAAARYGRSAEMYALFTEPEYQTPTYLSAAYDTLYIMDGARKIPIATTNGEGKSFDALLEPGTYTIYSSVAKDPSNLSNPYGKTVTITAATQTVKVMPDGALYWWGYEGDNLEDTIDANGWSNTWGKTLAAPTRNANDLEYPLQGSNIVRGVGTKNKINANTMNYIVKSTTVSGGKGLFMYMLNTKAMSSPTEIVEVYQSVSNTVQKISEDISSYGDEYLMVRSDESRAGNCYAFWYE